MKHAKKGYKLGRTASHRKATLASLSGALIRHKRIVTTLTKAKALRIYIEPLITRARVDNTHNRREVFRHLMDKYAVTELFDEISEKVGDRPGGYTRVLRLGQRPGDAAQMAVIELVDYNDSDPEDSRSQRRRTRRGRRRRSVSAPQEEILETAPDLSSEEGLAEASVEEDVVESETADAEPVEAPVEEEEVKSETAAAAPVEASVEEEEVKSETAAAEPVEAPVEEEEVKSETAAAAPVEASVEEEEVKNEVADEEVAQSGSDEPEDSKEEEDKG